MGKVFDEIDDSLDAWIREQHLFFVATAPLSAEGHVNVSPRGLDSLSILDPHTVAWLDLTGSGAVATKKRCCSRIQASRLSSISWNTLPMAAVYPGPTPRLRPTCITKRTRGRRRAPRTPR